VLDPAQNHAFREHYLEVPLDLSNVLFIATRNQLGTIHRRCSIAWRSSSLAAYTEEEKDHIAKMYLVRWPSATSTG
jgi:ATP-dependent Lon protease